jgi:glycosyltransferase involved in cell wall biosynthesis
VISDNASTDSTQQVIRIYQSKFPLIRCQRWDETVPVDRNILKAVELARGEYCWIFGDDDALNRGAIEAVIEALAEDHDQYLLNSTIYDEEFVFLQLRPPLNVTEDTIFLLSDRAERHEYCRKARTLEAFFGFISTQVFRRELWSRSIESDSQSFNRFLGSRFLHAWVLLNSVNVGRVSLKYLAKPLVRHRFLRDPRRGADKLLEPGVWMGAMIDAYTAFARAAFGPNSFEEFHIRRVMRFGYKQVLHPLLGLKATSMTPEAKQAAAKMAELLCIGAGPGPRLAYLVYRLAPAPVCRILRRVYRTMKNRPRLTSRGRHTPHAN